MEITKERLVCPANNKFEVTYPSGLGPIMGTSFSCGISVKGSVSFVISTAKAGGAQNVPDVVLAEEASYKGARLLAFGFVKGSSSDEKDQLADGETTNFVYVGKNFEFKTTVTGNAGLSQFERYLGLFRIEEVAGGIVLKPRGSRISMETSSLYFWVEGVGPVTCTLGDGGMVKPRSRGRRSAVGKELWTLNRTNPDVLVGGKTTTTRVRASRRKPVGSSFPDLVENLSVEQV